MFASLRRAFSTATSRMSKAFVQREAPAWSATAVMPDGSFKDLKLSDYRGRRDCAPRGTIVTPSWYRKVSRFLLLSARLVSASNPYYPKERAWIRLSPSPPRSTFVCPTEIIAYSERVEEFKKRDCEVVACSVDSEFSHLAWYEGKRRGESEKLSPLSSRLPPLSHSHATCAGRIRREKKAVSAR